MNRQDYHVVHHHSPSTHWTDAPVHFEANKAKCAAPEHGARGTETDVSERRGTSSFIATEWWGNRSDRTSMNIRIISPVAKA